MWKVNSTGTKKGSIMKQTAFWREKQCAACLRYSSTYILTISRIYKQLLCVAKISARENTWHHIVQHLCNLYRGACSNVTTAQIKALGAYPQTQSPPTVNFDFSRRDSDPHQYTPAQAEWGQWRTTSTVNRLDTAQNELELSDRSFCWSRNIWKPILWSQNKVYSTFTSCG
jgi:hypothetical protein